ncbi:MAG: hypothetical protein REI11_11585 [Patulibacter sp.]|nr:hypothetical protein [Patulibacter sp.]
MTRHSENNLENKLPYKDLEALKDLVNDQAVVATTLGELRKAIEYERLGKYVLGHIRSRLQGEGLGCFPAELLDPDHNSTPRQDQTVRVYRLGSTVADLVQAVLDPSPTGDRALRQANEGKDDAAALAAAVTLEKIRELVLDA